MFQGTLLVSEELFAQAINMTLVMIKVVVNIRCLVVLEIFGKKFARSIELEEKNSYFSEQLQRLPFMVVDISEFVSGGIHINTPNTHDHTYETFTR